MMKMILILTNKDDITVDFVIKELQRQDIMYYRLNTEDIPHDVEISFFIDKGIYILHDKNKSLSINLKEIDAVYFRRAEVSSLDYIEDVTECEKKYLRGELAYFLEGLYKVLRDKFWLNNIFDIREAENKIYQLQLAQDIGFSIPESIISNIPRNIEETIIEHEKDCIIKPIKSGNMKSENDSQVIFTSKIGNDILDNTKRIDSFPLFIQQNIHKSYDLRCIVVGGNVYCAQIDSQRDIDSKIDWRKSKKHLEHTVHNLEHDIANKCVEMTKRLGLNYSAIDLILDHKGDYIFLECNPNGQWAWLEHRLSFPISESIVNMLKRGIPK